MKAIIMAGGKGVRLRPLTCGVPKPMARILGKPIIEYIFDSLVSHGTQSASVTLGYLPEIIPEAYGSEYLGMKLEYIREDEPLGTAGGVRNAASDFDEPFVVISGDAMCDFDVGEIAEYHRARKAMATIVAVEASDPREYGLLKADDKDRAVGFIEKPSWSQAVSSLANAGVYVIDPRCLELIPEGESFDFAADLFPLMLKKNMPVYCYRSNGYWCDAGNVETYLKCQKDIFDGKMRAPVKPAASGVYLKDEAPRGDYGLIPPVYIGSRVKISDGAVIGPYAVADDGCFVGPRARIRYSAALENASIAADAELTGALVCSGATIKRGAKMFENAAAGSGAIIGREAIVKPNVSVWPGKIVEAGAVVSENLKYGGVKAKYLGENGISEGSGARLNAEICVRLGSAVGGLKGGRKTGVGDDGSAAARIMSLGVAAGLAGEGSETWDFGECFEAELDFLTNFCGLDAGLFVKGGGAREIRICGGDGLSIPRYFEREIESGMSKRDFREIPDDEIKEITDAAGVKRLYGVELVKSVPGGLKGVKAILESDNRRAEALLADCFSRLGGVRGGDVRIIVDESGKKARAIRGGEEIGAEKLLAICCLDEIRRGGDAAAPYDAPAFLDSVAERFGRKIYRYLSAPADGSDLKARELASKQKFAGDGLFLAFRVLSIMKESGKDLKSLVSELPEKYIVSKNAPIRFSPSRLSAVIGGDMNAGGGADNGFEGVTLIKDAGRTLVIPKRGGAEVKILVEADSAEAADELCADIENRLGSAPESPED